MARITAIDEHRTYNGNGATIRIEISIGADDRISDKYKEAITLLDQAKLDLIREISLEKGAQG